MALSYRVIPELRPPVIVDGFQYATRDMSDVYFLTHFHSDHYGPLTGKRWEAVQGIIYCSEVTARLVRLKLRVPERFLRPLPLGTAVRLRDSHGRAMDGGS